MGGNEECYFALLSKYCLFVCFINCKVQRRGKKKRFAAISQTFAPQLLKTIPIKDDVR